MRWLFLGPLVGACSTAPFPLAVLERAPQDDPGGYTVSGTATIESAPDCADLIATLSVETRQPADATRRLRERQSALLADLSARGLSSADVAVSTLRLSPVRELVDPRGAKTRVRGYEAAVTVTLTTRDFDALAGLLEAVASHGATTVTTAFRVSDLPAVRSRAREQAAVAARAKAETVAAALGTRLGRVRAIQEDAAGSMLGNRNYFANESTPGSPQEGLHGESQAVTVSLTVTYELPG